MLQAVAELAESAESLLDAVGGPSDVTLVRSWGNRGSDLTYAGMRRLLRHHSYRECDIRKLNQTPAGKTAIIAGGGSWCKPFHLIAAMLPVIEARFSRVIVFPSSFDTEEAMVRKVLSRTGAVVFARERESYEQIRRLCDARLAHDTAFFFDFAPYQSGFHEGVLNAFRMDAEATGAPIPEENRDISNDCDSLDEWLWTIGRHDLIRTDRAHVAMAAAMLGKRVECRSSSYHKVPAIVEFSISSGQVTLLEQWNGAATVLPIGTPALADGSSLEHVIGELDRAIGQSAVLKAEVGRLAAESINLAETGGRLGAELAAREAELAARAQENARLQLLGKQVEKRLTDSSRQLRTRESELSWTIAELQESRHAVKALRESWSWRLTSPLRAVLDLALNLQRLTRGAVRRISFRSKALGYLQWLWYRRQVLASGLFDENYYVAHNPDVARSRTDPLRHFFVFGAVEGRNPHPDFDTSYYIERNPDVALRGINPLVHHLEQHAARNLREPISVESSPQAPPAATVESGGLPPRMRADPRATELRMALRANYETSGRPPLDSEYDSIPLVSVVIPCYNHGCYLEDAILSAMMACSYPMEILVVDDGSTEADSISAVDELTGRYRFRLLRQCHTGLAGACHTGFQNSFGKFIQFLDSEDLLASGKIDLQVDMTIRDSGIDIAVCEYEMCGADGTGCQPIGPSTPAGFDFDPQDFLVRWERGFALPVHCALFRREILGAKHFSPVTEMGREDWIFWMLLVSASRHVEFHPEVLATFRIHNHYRSTNREAAGLDLRRASI